MDWMLTALQSPSAGALAETERELLACNEYTRRFGLALTDEEAHSLAVARTEALRRAGRMEPGGGILPELIHAFCDSPYLLQDSYAATLEELQEAFYYFKSEAEERLTDSELLEYMVSVFNGRAQGSTDDLLGTSLEALCRHARNGFDAADGAGLEALF